MTLWTDRLSPGAHPCIPAAGITNGSHGGLFGLRQRPGQAEPTNWTSESPNNGTILFGMAQRGVDGNPTPVTVGAEGGALVTITLKALQPTGSATLTIGGNSMLVDWPDAFEIDYSVVGPATINLSSCAPTDIALSKTSVAENMPVPALVGNLSATDPDPADLTFTYTLVDLANYPDNDAFSIVSGILNTAQVFNFETKSSYDIKIRATDPHGEYFDKVFTISVTDVNDAPVLAAIGPKSVANTSTLSFTPTASDEDLPAQALSWSLGAGAPTWVSIVSGTGLVTIDPADGTALGPYQANICVSDGVERL